MHLQLFLQIFKCFFEAATWVRLQMDLQEGLQKVKIEKAWFFAFADVSLGFYDYLWLAASVNMGRTKKQTLEEENYSSMY